MTDIIIKNGRLIDPVNNIDQLADIQISDGKITAIAAGNTIDASANTQLIDASNLTSCRAWSIAAPGCANPAWKIKPPSRVKLLPRQKLALPHCAARRTPTRLSTNPPWSN